MSNLTLLANNALDMRKVLLKFQELMKIEYSKRDAVFWVLTLSVHHLQSNYTYIIST